jgi:excisionase family DNA binding protein
MNLTEAARRLGRSQRWVSKQIHSGRLDATMQGRERVIAEADVARLGSEIGVATGLSMIDTHAVQTHAIVERLAALERQQVAFTDCDARLVDTLRQQPPVGQRLAAIEREVTALARQTALLVTLGHPGGMVLTVAQFADLHQLEVAQVDEALVAHIPLSPLSPVYGAGAVPLIGLEGHVALAAKLREQGVAFTTCPDCAPRGKARRRDSQQAVAAALQAVEQRLERMETTHDAEIKAAVAAAIAAVLDTQARPPEAVGGVRGALGRMRWR